MSNRICERCKSSVVLPWNNVKDFYKCMNCSAIGYSDKFPEKTVFDRITVSPEVLAEKLVYRYDGNGTWRSFLLYGYEFLTKEEAYAATVAELNKVCVEQNAVDDTQARLRKVDDTQKEVAE